MQKSLNEKIQSWAALLSILIIFGDVVLHFYSSNEVQNTQISYLSDQICEIKTSQKETNQNVKDLSQKLDHLIEIKYAKN